jgi:hypothetical protein
MLLDSAREEVDIRTHGIVHLENHVETQDTELEERAERIADLEQQCHNITSCKIWEFLEQSKALLSKFQI